MTALREKRKERKREVCENLEMLESLGQGQGQGKNEALRGIR